MIKLFHDISQQCSKAVTEKYSTSFSSAIKLLHPDLRTPIYNIYGFVRFADEIVDTFHQYKKEELLTEFKKDTYAAIERGISLNPILHSFQISVREYNISHDLIEAFFSSMEMDLRETEYNSHGYKNYIYGSAEVVGLMCLYVFCEGDKNMYNDLKPAAQALGAAFQKVNFLRDLKSDFQDKGRVYFPGVDFSNFSGDAKLAIEADIQKDFDDALRGILNLPIGAKNGVYLAYVYYLKLFKKIQKTSAARIQHERIRINDIVKFTLLAKTLVKGSLGVI